MSDIKIAVVGCSGRMGVTLLRQITDTEGCAIIGGSEAPGHAAIGTDIGEIAGLGSLGISVVEDPLELFAHADAVLDFTVPAASVTHAAFAAQARIVLVMGTTGFSPEQDKEIEAAARHATIIRAGNMSIGVNLMATLVRRMARVLDPDFDIEILEMHHRHKVDAPSGTALLLGEAAAEGRGVNLDDVADRGRDGQTGARKSGDIGFAVLRGGAVIGDHSVIFASDNERIEITHKAEDRGIFAHGALKAVQWGYNGGTGRGPGLFSMVDVLGLDDS